MKFLVLGATGMAGHTIALFLDEQGHDVTGFCRKPAGFVRTIAGDARDSASLERIIADDAYDVVINAVGLLNDDAETRRDDAVLLNSYLPHMLVAATAGMSTRVFHMSTDCVFAGNSGPYSETDYPDGRTFYDRTKALGELNDDKNLTFRNSVVGPDISEDGIGLLNWFMKQAGPVKGFTKAIWTGLTTLELAKAMESCAHEDVSGLINMVPRMSISKFDLLNLFNRHLRDSRIEIIPSEEHAIDKTLVRTNRRSSFEPAAYDCQVAEMAEWMRRHSNLYPHYGLDVW